MNVNPLPWKPAGISFERLPDGKIRSVVGQSLWVSQEAADAISKAVECHDELLAACRAVREQLISHMQGAWPGTMSITAKRVDNLLAIAIGKAEERNV